MFEITLTYSVIYLEICIPSFKSCLEIAKNQSSTPRNGVYEISETQDCNSNQKRPARWSVFCDFNSEPGYAWTLIESFSRHHRNDLRINRAFSSSNGVNNLYKDNLSLYRQSLFQMLNSYERDRQLISEPMWRATCNFNIKTSQRYSSPDNYMRGYFNQFNILNYVGQGQCQLVNYINIRGQVCRDCRRAFWARQNAHLHTDSSTTICCNGKQCYTNAVSDEDNFGYYQHYNTAFSCTGSSESTTNWWIGGKI